MTRRYETGRQLLGNWSPTQVYDVYWFSYFQLTEVHQQIKHFIHNNHIYNLTLTAVMILLPKYLIKMVPVKYIQNGLRDLFSFTCKSKKFRRKKMKKSRQYKQKKVQMPEAYKSD